jgi:hypothetical protein
MDNQQLAELIYGVASYDGYNTSVLQTQQNLSSKKENQQFASEKDRYIFEDLQKAIIFASQQTELTVDIFKAINAQMDSKEEDQPEHPGILRKNYQIHVGDYFPPLTVTEKMVQRELDAVKDHSVAAGWELYARLAKLQAFDNGNKRTALLCANLLTGALQGKSQDYLTIPTDFRRAQFDANMIMFYMADDWDDHLPDVDYSLKQFVAFATETTEMIKIKSKFKSNKFYERLTEATVKQKSQLLTSSSEVLKQPQAPKL